MGKKIAILLATYNGEKFLKEQLDSLVNQTNTDFTCYIHDDGSKDKTVDVINKYCKEFPYIFRKLDYVNQNKSAKDNFLSMLKIVNEEYIMFCDQDDLWIKDKVSVTYNKMCEIEKDRNIPTCIFTDMKVVNENLKLISESYLKMMNKNPKKLDFKSILLNNVVAGCTSMINRSAADLCNNYSNEKNILMHDWWFALITSLCGKICYLDEKTILYRQHDNNVVGAYNQKSLYLKNIITNIVKLKQIEVSKNYIKAKQNICRELQNKPIKDKNEKIIIDKLSNLDQLHKLEKYKFLKEIGIISKNPKNIWKILIL